MHSTLRFSVRSEPGLRPNNEDAAFAGPRLLALADGMGGHAAGEIAASLALRELIGLNEGVPSRDILRDLRDAVNRANAAIARRNSSDPETAGMGTTLTALLFANDRVALAHVGDSRAYLLRKTVIRQITRDDTLVQSLVDQGRLTPEEAVDHPQRNMVVKVLTGQAVQPHFEVLECHVGDRFLICSDGLSDYVAREEIARILRVPDVIRRPQELISLALRHGSSDNITCVLGEIVAGDSGYNIALTTGAAGRAASLVRT